jgi:O-antigen biosynthesis protein
MTAGIRVLLLGTSFDLPGYELCHLQQLSGIHSAIAAFQPDVLVTSGVMPGALSDAGLELRKRWIHVDPGERADVVARQIEACYAFNLWSRHPLEEALPLVSVFTPSFDSGDYLREAYQSLREQTYKNWEWVVVDDHSGDGTWQRLEALAREDVRVRPFRSGKRLGKIGASKDAATRLCRGAYLVELDHDDLLTDRALAELVRTFAEHPQVGMVYSNSASFYEDGASQRFDDPFWADRYRSAEYRGRAWLECRNPDIYDRFGPDFRQQFAWFLTVGPHHVRAFRASTFCALGGYNPELPVADDWDLLARFFLRSQCYHLDQLLYLYRYRDQHQNATFTRNQAIQDHLELGRAHYADEFRAFNDRRLANEHALASAASPSAAPPSAAGEGLRDSEPSPRPSDSDARVIARPASTRVIAIARNEVAAVAGFFQQFEGFTRDFCLLDTGSSDGTIGRAEALGVRVEQAPFTDFAAARNEALARFAPGADWILMLDLDERLDPATICRLGELVAHATHDIYLAPLEAVAADGSRQRFVPKAFLFRAVPSIRWAFKVHEKLLGSHRQALLRNARIDHLLALHEPERRSSAEVQYAQLMEAEPYFSDADFRRRIRDAWPILDYDHVEDSRIAAFELGPLVSVVIPTFRRGALLARAVASALSQDYAPFEVIVVGDGCPELSSSAFAPEPRVRVHNLSKNHGAGGAAPRNYGIAAARGRLIAYLDDDNSWAPCHLSSLVGRLLESSASFAFSSMHVDGKTLEFTEPKLGSIDTSCIVHERALIERHGDWKDRQSAGYAHDFELVARWLAAGERWVATRQATLAYNARTSQQAEFLAAR